MKGYEAAGIGTLMGCLYGVVLWASTEMYKAYLDAFAYEQTRLLLGQNMTIAYLRGNYVLPATDPNMYYMPFLITGIVVVFAFLLLFSVSIWYPYAERWFDGFSKDIIAGWRDERDDDDEDDDE
jgi:hypothetical protein